MGIHLRLFTRIENKPGKRFLEKEKANIEDKAERLALLQADLPARPILDHRYTHFWFWSEDSSAVLIHMSGHGMLEAQPYRISLICIYDLQANEVTFNLRDCLKSKSEASQHQSRSGDEDKSGAVLLFGFVISGQSAGLGQPSEGALHDPPLWLDDKATGFEVAAFDDVEAKPSAWNSRAQSFSQSRSAVSAIRPKLTQPAVAP